MNDAPGLAVVAVLVCAFAGLAIPAVIATLPPPVGAVGASPRLAIRAAGTCALVGTVLALGLGASAGLLVPLTVVPHGVLLAIVDLRTRLLPTRVVWPMLGLAWAAVLLVGVLTRDGDAVLRAAIGAVGVSAFFHLLWWVRPDGMGYGDVRLSVVVGTVLGFLGWAELVVGVYAGFLAFALVAIARAVVRRDRGSLRTASPYGPFLLGGAVAGAVLGEPVWNLVAG